MLRALAIAAVLVSAWPSAAAAAAEVTIYRCIDAKGRLTLRDTPCAKGEQQETRTMLRPKDAAPRPPAPRAAAYERDRERTRVVVAYSPRPMYECVTPGGERYTSESAEGNPRWVPLWTLGFPVVPRSNPLGDRVGAPLPPRPDAGAGSPRLRPEFVAFAPGTWVRDECYALPQAEVCDRMLDRRDELRRRFFNAMPSERDVLRREERGLNARLDSDCGGA